MTLTLTASDDYVITPPQSATILIHDNFGTNIFVPVVTNLDSPVGIDYHAPSNALVVSYHYIEGGSPNAFALVLSNGGLVTNWSGVSGLNDEVKIATVKETANGWTSGDMYFGSDLSPSGGAVGVGWLSSDGTVSNLTWGILTNDVVTNALALRGGLYLDQTGVFSNELVAVASDSADSISYKGVWLVDTNRHPTLLTQINTLHLEGAITLTNDAQRWGPWAGTILTGDESAAPEPLIFAISTNRLLTSFGLGIAPEDFDIIPPNQNLYCVNYDDNNPYACRILKLSGTLLTNYVNDLLITQAGEISGPPTLFIAHWDSTNVFVIRSISLPDSFPGHFEHVTFAPIDLPPLTQ